MSRFGLIGPSYQSQSVLADCQMTMNWILEAIESGMGRSAYAMYPRPGLSMPLYAIGSAGVRGETSIGGRSFAVAGAALWELLAPNLAVNVKNWSATLAVPIVSDGNPVIMAAGGHQILIASAGNAYVFDLTANTLKQVDPSAGANLPVAYVGYSDSFFFALIKNVAPVPWQINSSNSFDAATWQATNFTEVTPFTENPNAIYFNQRLMWAFSPKGIQPFSNTGDFPFPFDVIPGTYIEDGLGAVNSLVRMDNSFFWVSADERGQGMVKRMNGFTPVRISNHALEYAMQNYPTITDAVAWSYQEYGHNHLVLSFPSGDATWDFDAATNQWVQLGFWNEVAGKFTRHRAGFHTFNFGMHLVGDPTTGAVYQMASNILTDFGNPIRRVRRAPHISKELRRMTHARVQVDAEVGIGPNLQGNQATTIITLADNAGISWAVKVTDLGVLQVTKGSPNPAQGFYLTDPVAGTSWQLLVSTLGVLQVVSSPFAGPNVFPMASISGQVLWQLTIKQLTAVIGQLVVTLIGIVGRGPQWILRWSDDGGQTFNAGLARDGGQIGNYRQRLIWNRLGRPLLDRVYELSISEAVPARVIDAYLEAEGYEPKERLPKEMAKMA